MFENTQALALQIFGLVDARIPAHQNHIVKKAVGGEYRQADIAVIAAGQGDQQGRQRHFQNVEIAETKLAPKHCDGETGV